jgi:hypothetical protein
MKISHIGSGSGRLAPELFKFASIALLGIGVGILSTTYSPLFALLGTIAFTILAISLYVSSHHQSPYIVAENVVLPVVTESKSGLLFYLFYLSFFISITIPKSGKTVANIPITIANLLILFTLGWWLMTSLFSQKTIFHVLSSKPIILFMVYGVVAFLIGFINHNPRKYIVLDFVAFIGFIPVYFLVCHVIRTQEQLKRIVWAIGLSSFLVCSYGLLQTKLGFERIAMPGITEQYGKITYQGVGRWNVIEGGAIKVYSTFQNGNIFGNHLATFIPFLGGILIGLSSSKKKMLFLGIFLLSCYVLILTYSRGALFGTISGIMVLAVISKKIRLRAIVVVFLIFSVFFVFLQKSADRPELARYDFSRMTSNPEQFSAGRIERAKQVLGGFYNLPFPAQLFGIGFGGVLISPLGWRFEYVDNLYLTLLFKMGIVGLMMLIGMLTSLFLSLLKLRSSTPDLYFRGLINGGIAGLGASLIHNLADTLWFFPPLSANFWFLAGITMSIAVIGSRDPEFYKGLHEGSQTTGTRESR